MKLVQVGVHRECNMAMDGIASKLDVATFVWNVATGLYHLSLLYALNKYGKQAWSQSGDRSGAPWWKGLMGAEKKSNKKLATSEVIASAGVRADMKDMELHRVLDDLASKGWSTPIEAIAANSIASGRTSSEPELGGAESSQGRRASELILHADMSETMSEVGGDNLTSTRKEEEQEEKKQQQQKDDNREHQKEHHASATEGPCLPCSVVLTFQCALSDRQVHGWAKKVQKLFGSTPRVERFERSTVVQTQSRTYQGFLHDAAALVQEASEEDDLCTLQVDSWGVLLSYIGQKVELVNLRGVDVPVITSATPVTDEALELQGIHLDGSELIAQTHEQSIRLLSRSRISRGPEGSEALTVQWPPEAGLHQGVQVYASKTVAIDGSSIYVQSEPAKIMFMDVSSSTTDSTAWILAALILTVSVAQLSWSVLTASLGSSAAAVAGQGFGWILGWLTLQFLTARYARNQRALKMVTSVQAQCARIIVLILLSLVSWTCLAVLDPKLIFVVFLVVMVAIIVGAATGRRRKAQTEDTVSRRKSWVNLMNDAITYEEWAHAAGMLESEGDVNERKLYDEAFLQGKLKELQLRRVGGCIEDMLFSLRADLTRNLGNMCNPRLHDRRQQVPIIIQDYLNEVRYHLQAVCEMDPEEFTLEDKLHFFTETRQRFGRTTLVFSGHVALGTFHSSVFRTLVEHRLLPSVVVGANVGAIVASFATTRTSSELQHFFDDPDPPAHFYEKLSTVYVAAYRLRTQEASSYEIEKLQHSMQELLGDLTFEEAFALSGRVLGISVPACAMRNQPAQFLNYLTSPHVVIWSAAAVSCAPPAGLFHHPELMIKDRGGNIVPYVPPTKMTLHASGGDASLETEIPFKQLRELFNVNHFIISQSSPYIAPWLHFKDAAQNRSSFASKLVNLVETEARHRCAQLVDLGVKARGFTGLYGREWEGDINIVLPMSFSQAMSMSRPHNDDPSPEELRAAAMAGRRCTWAKLAAIQASCEVELMLDDCISELNHREGHALSYTSREDNYLLLDDPVSPMTVHSASASENGLPMVTSKGHDFRDAVTHSRDDHPPPLDQSCGPRTPSEAGTEDYLLDHLCSCTRNNPEKIYKGDSRGDSISHGNRGGETEPVGVNFEVAEVVDNKLVHVDNKWVHVDEPSDKRGEVGPDEAEGVGGDPEPDVESVDEEELFMGSPEREGREDSERYDSPTTVLDGPTGRGQVQGKNLFNDPGCNVRSPLGDLNSID